MQAQLNLKKNIGAGGAEMVSTTMTVVTRRMLPLSLAILGGMIALLVLAEALFSG